jgi:hypothetical protein
MAYTLDDLTDVPSGIYDRLKQKFVNFNKPDAEFADLPYEAQTASIERRQKLADLLQQQARSPIEIQSYKGIQAPIATTAGLSKVLDSIMAGYEEGDTATQAKEAAKAQEADTKYTLGEVEKATSPAYRAAPVTRGALADIPGAQTSTGPMTAMPAGAAPTVAPDEADLSAGMGNRYDAQADMAKIPSAFGNRQALDSGYTGLSGQSLQQGSHQDLVKALLHSKVSALRNAGLTMATTPEKLYTLNRGDILQTAGGEVRGKGQPAALSQAAPTTRSIMKGGIEIQQQWDPYTQTFNEVGRGPRSIAQPKVPKSYVVTLDGKDGIMTEAQLDAAHKKGIYPKIRAPNFLLDLFAGAQQPQQPEPGKWGNAAEVPAASN